MSKFQQLVHELMGSVQVWISLTELGEEKRAVLQARKILAITRKLGLASLSLEENEGTATD